MPRRRLGPLMVCALSVAIGLGAAGAALADQGSPKPMPEDELAAIADCEACHEIGAAGGAVAGGSEGKADEDEGAGAPGDGAKGDAAADAVEKSYFESHPQAECLDCHIADEAFGKSHKDKTADDRMPKKLRRSDVTTEKCQECHGTYEDLAELTEDVEVLTDSKGTCVNPHAAVALTEEHDGAFDCFSCHGVHKPVEDVKDEACLRCHHEDVFECGTCHN